MPTIKQAYEAYVEGGQYAVYDLFWDEPNVAWEDCEPCEDYTPTIKGQCAVCGTLRVTT